MADAVALPASSRCGVSAAPVPPSEPFGEVLNHMRRDLPESHDHPDGGSWVPVNAFHGPSGRRPP
jgi:hypothetical protein